MQKYFFELNTKYNENIVGDICLNLTQKSPICIILHGFKGHKDWGFLPFLSEQLAKNNIIAIKYNFSLNGFDNQDFLSINVDKFKLMTVSRQLEELNFIISNIKTNTLTNDLNLEQLWDGRIFLCGHSMGGAISILYSSIYSEISKLVLLAPISKFDRYSVRQKNLWRKQGFIDFPNTKTEQILRLNSSYLDDFEKNSDKFNVPNAISKLQIPILLLHGKQDVTVQVNEPNELINSVDNNYFKYKFIENTGHTFSIENKGIKNNEVLATIINDIIEFL